MDNYLIKAYTSIINKLNIMTNNPSRLYSIDFDTRYYVYCLIDPTDNKIFYVGKGKDDRIFQHELLARSNKASNNNKYLYNKIKKILKSGNKIIYKKLYTTNNNEAAYHIEWFCIYKLGLDNLCNIVSGGSNSKVSKRKYKKLRPKLKETKTIYNPKRSPGLVINKKLPVE